MEIEVYRQTQRKWQITSEGVRDLLEILEYFRSKEIHLENTKRYISFFEDMKYEEEGEYSLSNGLLILEYAGDSSYEEIRTLFAICLTICNRKYHFLDILIGITKYCPVENFDIETETDYYRLPVEKRVEFLSKVGLGGFTIFLLAPEQPITILQKVINLQQLIAEVNTI